MYPLKSVLDSVGSTLSTQLIVKRKIQIERRLTLIKPMAGNFAHFSITTPQFFILLKTTEYNQKTIPSFLEEQV